MKKLMLVVTALFTLSLQATLTTEDFNSMGDLDLSKWIRRRINIMAHRDESYSNDEYSFQYRFNTEDSCLVNIIVEEHSTGEDYGLDFKKVRKYEFDFSLGDLSYAHASIDDIMIHASEIVIKETYTNTKYYSDGTTDVISKKTSFISEAWVATFQDSSALADETALAFNAMISKCRD